MIVDDELKRKVWKRGETVEGFNPDMYRKDACGAWIVWNKYGIKDNVYGWEIDHVYPQSRLEKKGFSEEDIWNIDNLRPLQHQNNASKQDDYPSYTAVITADGNRNIEKEQNLVVNEKRRKIISELYHLN